MPAVTTQILTQLMLPLSCVLGRQKENGELAWGRINSNIDTLIPKFAGRTWMDTAKPSYAGLLGMLAIGGGEKEWTLRSACGLLVSLSDTKRCCVL